MPDPGLGPFTKYCLLEASQDPEYLQYAPQRSCDSFKVTEQNHNEAGFESILEHSRASVPENWGGPRAFERELSCGQQDLEGWGGRDGDSQSGEERLS